MLSIDDGADVISGRAIDVSEIVAASWRPAKDEFCYFECPVSFRFGNVLTLLDGKGEVIQSREFPFGIIWAALAWSPKGDKLALFTEGMDDESVLQLLSPDLKTLSRRPLKMDGWVYSARWHPRDPGKVVIQLYRGKRKVDLREVDISTGTVEYLAPILSPSWRCLQDGSVAYSGGIEYVDGVRKGVGDPTLWTYDTAAKRSNRVADALRVRGPLNVGWLPRASKAAVLTDQGVSVVDISSGAVQSVWPGVDGQRPSLSYDGTKLAVALGDQVGKMAIKDLVSGRTTTFVLFSGTDVRSVSASRMWKWALASCVAGVLLLACLLVRGAMIRRHRADPVASEHPCSETTNRATE